MKVNYADERHIHIVPKIVVVGKFYSNLDVLTRYFLTVTLNLGKGKTKIDSENKHYSKNRLKAQYYFKANRCQKFIYS